MGEKLNRFKELVNKNIAPKTTVAEAKRFLQEVLVGKISTRSYENFGLKLRILACVKVVLADEFNISPDSIKYNVIPLDINTIMGLRRSKGDGSHIIVINENLVESMLTQEFILSLLHEYGHILQVELRKKGEDVPDAIFVDSNMLAFESPWQVWGSKFKYGSNMNEFNAQYFARQIIDQWISDYSKEKGITLDLVKGQITNKVATIGEKISLNRYKLLLSGWRGVNKLFKIKESEVISEEDPGNDIVNIIIELEETLKSSFQVKNDLDATEFLKTAEKGVGDEDLSSKQEFMFKLELLNAFCYQLAKKIDRERSEVGFVLYPEVKDFIEFIETKKYNPSSPLIGYYAVDVNEFDRIKLDEFYSRLKSFQANLKLDNIKNEEKES